MHLLPGQNQARAIKCPVHTAGISCRKMPNAAPAVIGHATQLKLRKAKRATRSQLSLVSFRAWDIFIKDTSLRGVYGCSGRSRSGALSWWKLSHLPDGVVVSLSFTSPR